MTASATTALPAEWTLAGGTMVRSTGWGQGDMGGSGAAVERRRRCVVDLPWTVLDQVHGARVVAVEQPGGSAGEAADGAVTALTGTAIAVLTADCAPIALSSTEGIIGIAHAGWKGLRAGIVEATVQAMRRLGATRVEAVLGPCIHPCCYTFGEDQLAEVESRLRTPLRSVDHTGQVSLDLPAGVRAVVHAAGATLVGESQMCTACSDGLWSWRDAATARRQAMVAWRP